MAKGSEVNLFYRLQLWFMTAVTVTIAVATVWMIRDDQPPYEYDPGSSFIMPNPTPDDSRVVVDWRIKVNRLCPGSSSRVLLDARTRRTVATYDATPAATTVQKTDTSLVRTFVLPKGLPEEVIYKSTICFRCNPLHAFWPLCVTTPELYLRISNPTPHSTVTVPRDDN